MSGISVRAMQEKDWDVVRTIYQAGIDSGNATFQTFAPEWREWDENHIDICRYVACIDNQVIGWVALSPYSSRHAYRGVAEISIYISPRHHQLGAGKQLLSTIINESEKAGYWTLLSGIFPENLASLRLHHSQGFRKVGHREKVGEMHGKWRDVIILERRSQKVNY
jgi:L-amino acid N-acyltransferase YncA